MNLVLDTNAYRLVMQGDVRAMALVRAADRISMPVPVLAELLFGFRNGTRGRENEAHLSRFLERPRVATLPCDEDTCVLYADLKLQLKKQGTPIPIHDVWIAALVLQHGGTLFTRDSDFDHLPQLQKV